MSLYSMRGAHRMVWGLFQWFETMYLFFGAKGMSWGKGSRVAASGSLGLPLSFPNSIRTCGKVWYLEGWEGMRMIKITPDFESRYVLQRAVCLIAIVLAAWARLCGWESERERWDKWNTKEQKPEKRENKMKGWERTKNRPSRHIWAAWTEGHREKTGRGGLG